jgi:hypothetical protein
MSGSLASMVVADFDNDGKPDFAALDAAGNSLLVKLNRSTSSSTLVANDIAVAGGGSHSVTANYSGDSVYPQSTSNTVTLVSTTSSDFTIASATSSQTIAPGQSANYTISLTPQNSFDGTVALSCSGLPPGYSCGFAPASLALTATPATSVMTISAAPSAAIAPPVRNGADLALLSSFLASIPIRLSPLPEPALLLLTSMALFFLAFTRTACTTRIASTKRYAARFACVIAFATVGLLQGCGNAPITPPISTTYTVTVTGTSGTLKHSTTVTLVVKVAE